MPTKIVIDLVQNKDTAVKTFNDIIEAESIPTVQFSTDARDQLATAGQSKGTQAYNVMQELSAMNQTEIADAVVRLVNSVNVPVAEAVSNNMETVTSNVNNRIGNLISFTQPAITVGDMGQVLGVAAGDDRAMYGVWATPIFGTAKQKGSSSIAGYKIDTYGATVGIDASPVEEAVIGGAFTFAKSKSKYKGFKVGDKTDMNSYLLSIYGMYEFTNALFAQAVATYGATKVENQEKRRISNTVFETAKGKYTAKSYNAELMVGYNHLVNNQFSVTPMVGFDYFHANGNKYTETGTTNQNLKVDSKAYSKLEVVAGLKLTALPSQLSNYVDVTPELHGFVRHNVKSEDAKVNLQTVDGSLNVNDSAKLGSTYGNVGFSVNARAGMFEYGAGYDLNLAKKYLGHQGSVKLRVNF